jgi:CubicO group peptidase (beta-lactamase class C family)
MFIVSGEGIMIKRGIATLLIYLTFTSLALAQLKDPLRKIAPTDSQYAELQKKIDQLDRYFTQKHQLGALNGNVLIAIKGVPIYKESFGYAVKETKERLNIKSSFQMASTSKPFTAAAVLMLVDQGKVNLDATLDEYFKGFPYEGVTVRMLLSHRTGLPDYLNFAKLYYKGSYLTNKDVVDMMVNKKPKALNKPDRVFDYNNTNYALLAALVEEISGMSFSAYVEKHIFKPLGMNDTWVWNPREARKSNETYGYNASWKKRSPDMFDGVAGDKGVYSTVEDMLKWDQAWYDCTLISEKLVKEAYKPYSGSSAKNYGLGWRMNEGPTGSQVIYHNGWWHEYNIVFKRFISDSTTIIVLSNKYNQDVYKTGAVENILFNDTKDMMPTYDSYFAVRNNDDDNNDQAVAVKYVMPSNPTPFQIRTAAVEETAENASQGGDESEQSIWHFVKKGDTLFNIAQRYNLSVETLKKWNKIAGANIQLGQKLLVKN